VKEYRPRLNAAEMDAINALRRRGGRRILVIGDLHAPFIRKGYLEHCVAIRIKYNCNHVVFIGDIVDNHYSSFHDTDPDGYGAGQELDRAIDLISEWKDEFPEADVVLGNHDRIIMRKVFSAGLSKRWIKDFGEVLETPGWNFDLEFEYDNVLYMHGEGGGGEKGVLTKALNRRKSVVQGHWHTQNHINWNVSEYDRIYGMQIGCGVDDKSYAMAYAKYNIKKSILSCGVVLENGDLPIIEPMRL
jgi:predicted phosphodiesterase